MQGYDSSQALEPSDEPVRQESGLQMSKVQLVTALKWWIVFASGALVGMGILNWIDYVK
jgi:hypothetical protein